MSQRLPNLQRHKKVREWIYILDNERTSWRTLCIAPKQEASSPAKSAPTPTVPMDHHDIDTSKLKKPLSPAVLNLVLRHHIKDVGAIKASGPGGRILKGDVLAHLGFIPYKPAPPMRTSAAPPRDQIVFAKVHIAYSHRVYSEANYLTYNFLGYSLLLKKSLQRKSLRFPTLSAKQLSSMISLLYDELSMVIPE